MSDKINILQIIGKHSPLLAAAIEHNKSTEINPENVKLVIKEIVEAVVDKCAEEGDNLHGEYEDHWQGQKESILNVKQLIDYGTN